MSNNKSKEITIIERIRSCIEELDLRILEEKIEGEQPLIISERNFGIFSMIVLTEVVSTQDMVCIEILFSHAVNKTKWKRYWILSIALTKI